MTETEKFILELDVEFDAQMHDFYLNEDKSNIKRCDYKSVDVRIHYVKEESALKCTTIVKFALDIENEYVLQYTNKTFDVVEIVKEGLWLLREDLERGKDDNYPEIKYKEVNI